jgi:hypothetical protein
VAREATQLTLYGLPGWLHSQRKPAGGRRTALEQPRTIAGTIERGTVVVSGVEGMYGPGSSPGCPSYMRT